MKAVIVYESRYGNTEKIANAIASGLKRAAAVEVFAAAEAPVVIGDDVTLFVAGAPTEAHGITKPMAEYLERLGGVSAQLVATFDTRLRFPRWISGSAAVGIARALRAAGANEIAKPMSFFVTGKKPSLEAGELERAEAWGASLIERSQGPELDERAEEAAIAASAATTAAVNAVVLPHAK
jgi:flavodoxin